VKTAVDSNVLLDILIGTEAEAEAATRALRRAREEGPVVLSVIAYAEVANRFATRAALESYLSDLGITTESLDEESAYQAGRFFHAYRRRGGDRVRILPDFLIAAHAQEQADRLLTKDRGFYGTSFPKLKVLHPKTFN